MKFEKREITLNERDSILDVLVIHEYLAEVYLQGARVADRKEVRELIKKRLHEVIEEIYLLNDLLNDLQKKSVKEE